MQETDIRHLEEEKNHCYISRPIKVQTLPIKTYHRPFLIFPKAHQVASERKTCEKAPFLSPRSNVNFQQETLLDFLKTTHIASKTARVLSALRTQIPIFQTPHYIYFRYIYMYKNMHAASATSLRETIYGFRNKERYGGIAEAVRKHFVFHSYNTKLA